MREHLTLQNAFILISIIMVLYNLLRTHLQGKIAKKIRDNDIKHLEEAFAKFEKAVWIRIDSEKNRTDNQETRLSQMEGKIEAIYRLVNGKK